ncbi:MAG: hypothetical protein ACREP9_14625, partial [Candidatus Dormibacteraceae bacterium]
ALDLTTQAMVILEASVKAGGQGIDYLPIVLARRSDIELQLGRPNEAAADATRGLKMLQGATPPGTLSCNLGRAYLALGRAFEAQGKHEDARRAFQSAVKHLEDTLGPDDRDTRAARQLEDRDSRSQQGAGR